MNDTAQQLPMPESPKGNEAERTKQVKVVGWIAGTFVIIAGTTLMNAPIWPAAFGMAAIAAMVAIICCFILKRG